jgi:hypothetical protein
MNRRPRVSVGRPSPFRSEPVIRRYYACEEIDITRGCLTAFMPRDVVRTSMLDSRSMNWQGFDLIVTHLGL